MVGVVLNLFLEDLAGRGLGCGMLLGLGLVLLCFSAISFYTHREGLAQGVTS